MLYYALPVIVSAAASVGQFLCRETGRVAPARILPYHVQRVTGLPASGHPVSPLSAGRDVQHLLPPFRTLVTMNGQGRPINGKSRRCIDE